MAVLIEQKSRRTGRKNGRWGVQYYAHDQADSRPVLYLGKTSRADAANTGRHVDQLAAARAGKYAPPRETLAWLETVSADLRAKLVDHGLVAPTDDERAAPLDKMLADYIAKRKDLKPRTRTNLEQARNKLVKKFGADRDARTITKGDAADWRLWLLTEARGKGRGLSRSTIATHVKKARQVFDDAVSRRLLDENPFKGVKAGRQSNEQRMRYVPAADVRAVIAKCVSPEWKALFALARWGGLRVPSETSILEWSDVDFAAGRMTVRSPKTEHHEGKDSREVPLFPELRPYLADLFEIRPAGIKRVLGARLPDNPRTTAQKIIARAQIVPWPKLFQNLRSSCQTDLTAKFPQHVACAWLGNTEQVARKHYLQVTDADFTRAAGGSSVRPELHSELHSSHEATTGDCTPPDASKLPISSANSSTGIPPRGVEAPSRRLKKLAKSKNDIADYSAIADPDAISAEQSPKKERSAKSAALARMMASARGVARG